MQKMLACTLIVVLMLLAAGFAGGAHAAEAEEELASWYGPGLYGNPTASGEILAYGDYGAASLEYPLGTVLEVCYVGCTTVVVNDSGPYVAGRTLDLQQAPAEDIGLTAAGVDYVEAYPVAYVPVGYAAARQ